VKKFSRNQIQLKRSKDFSNTDFGSHLKNWLESKESTCAASTFSNYRSKAKLVDKFFKAMLAEEIKKSDIKDFIKKLRARQYANKTINEYLIVIRGIFDELVDNEVLEKSPAASVSNLKTLNDAPSPFSKAELSRIFSAAPEFSSEIALFRLGCLTGMRISELLAVAWEDIDFTKRQIAVQRARVQGKLKTPKTQQSRRVISVSAEVIRLLETLCLVTGKKPPKIYNVVREDNSTITRYKLRMLFINSNTGRAICNEGHYARYFFKPLLDSAQVNYRGPSNSRHTFASHMLTKGTPPASIAFHLGHRSTAMLFKHYARIIQEDSPNYIDDIDCLLTPQLKDAA
jgi:integrase